MRNRDAGPPRAGAKGNPALAEISLLMAVFFVGTDVVSVKYALEDLPPLVFMPFRYVVAGLLLLAAIGLLGRKGTVALGDLPAIAGLGLVGVAFNQVGYTVGLSLTSGSNASLVFATAPVLSLPVLRRIDPLVVGAWTMLLGGLAALPLAFTGFPGLSEPFPSVPTPRCCAAASP